jgi:hypothetical protein
MKADPASTMHVVSSLTAGGVRCEHTSTSSVQPLLDVAPLAWNTLDSNKLRLFTVEWK